VHTLLVEINQGIYALVTTGNLEFGEQLACSGILISLFERMEDFGMSAEMPIISWSEDGKVRIGEVEGVFVY